MPLYKNIAEGDLDIWLNNLKELTKNIVMTKDKFFNCILLYKSL